MPGCVQPRRARGSRGQVHSTLQTPGDQSHPHPTRRSQDTASPRKPPVAHCRGGRCTPHSGGDCDLLDVGNPPGWDLWLLRKTIPRHLRVPRGQQRSTARARATGKASQAQCTCCPYS